MKHEQLCYDDNLKIVSKIEQSLERIKMFEPEEGYYLAFSGGKDSIVCYQLLKMAGVKFDSHYNWTTVDPPELLYFIKSEYPDVEIHKPALTMWQLIEKKMIPPTRLARYCCRDLKEGGGMGRFVVTGVRWEESTKRKSRTVVEYDAYGSKSRKAIKNREIFLMSDNDEKRRMIENCQMKSKHILNAIVDWTEEDVWNFIRANNFKYPSLYDEGFVRIGCIGCPMAVKRIKKMEFKRWPKHKQNYIRAFDRMLKRREERGLVTKWKTGKEVFDWWVDYKDEDCEVINETDTTRNSVDQD